MADISNNEFENTTFRVASFEERDFQTIEPFPHPTQTSIMPVIAFRGDEFRPIGTCFAISNHGLVLTARHVIEDAMALAGLPPDTTVSPHQDWWIGALYTSSEKPEGTDADFMGGILPANTVTRQLGFDIGVMHLNLPTFGEANRLLRLPAIKISPGIPNVGENCVGIGYHSMKWKPGEKTDVQMVMQSYSASRGVIQEIHFPKRDSSRLNFPCFRTSARYDGGMSGGPIFGNTGAVIGVVCSSMGGPESDEYISYGSLIGPALTLYFDAKIGENIVEKRFLLDFVDSGSVLADESYRTLRIVREPNRLVINFGNNRIMQVMP